MKIEEINPFNEIEDFEKTDKNELIVISKLKAGDKIYAAEWGAGTIVKCKLDNCSHCGSQLAEKSRKVLVHFDSKKFFHFQQGICLLTVASFFNFFSLVHYSYFSLYIILDLLDFQVENLGTKMMLYHGTSITASRKIFEEGFKISTNGQLGAGVYLAREEKAQRFALVTKRRKKG